MIREIDEILGSNKVLNDAERKNWLNSTTSCESSFFYENM